LLRILSHNRIRGIDGHCVPQAYNLMAAPFEELANRLRDVVVGEEPERHERSQAATESRRTARMSFLVSVGNSSMIAASV
jgi:hypothetical protein